MKFKRSPISKLPSLFLAITMFCAGMNLVNAQSESELVSKVQNRNSGDMIVTSEHVSRTSGVLHIYSRKAMQGIEIVGTDSSVHIDMQGKVLQVPDRFLDAPTA